MIRPLDPSSDLTRIDHIILQDFSVIAIRSGQPHAGSAKTHNKNDFHN